MEVDLSPELESLVQNKVKTGHYNSVSEVLREALRLLEERDLHRQLRLQDMRKKIDEGWASLERGEGVDGEEFFNTLERDEQDLQRTRRRT